MWSRDMMWHFPGFIHQVFVVVLEKAIEVGSAFEGWSPREEDLTYRLILPLKPPRGHIFHLEPGPVWPMRNFRIRVESVCTCEMEQPAGETRCFLHDPEQEHRRNAGFSILDDLCTDSYLDVQKTARYFQMFVRRSWRALPLSAIHRLTVLPSDRSCKFCVTQRWGKRIFIELLFGVQEGDSDIFVSSQYTEAAYTPSTMWPETYAVAETKFFSYIARKAHPDTCYLRCLKLCVRCLLGTDFSTYTLKTVMMHVLIAKPLSPWHRRYFWEWLNDILHYLQRCLHQKRLNHFFIGNENVPEEIILPLELRVAEPFNLFQHLTQNPYASEHAKLEFEELQRRSVTRFVEIFIRLYQYIFSNTSFPVLEKAIEVGSAFEGWSPREEDLTYRLILPLKPPRGHIFHLEPGPVWPMRNFRIRVESVCTCEMEQPAGETRCFLHDPEQEHGRNAGFSILDDLCTDSYLDVQKTARYFQMFVRRSWRALPLSAIHRLTVLPSDRSCKFCVTQRWGKRIFIELLFGVQEGDSDIFVSSQYTEAAYTPSTMWPETYAVAETKFFSYIARKAHPDTCYLRCLKLCVRCLLGTDFSTYTLKTVMMHVLIAKPLSPWHRRYFWEWLNDILHYLQRCLHQKRLNHFFIGNENVPEEIILPLELRVAEPFNLFQHLTQNPYASEHAKLEFEELQRRVHRMLLDGR
ncbi:inositol 1; 4; 5-trisphosphate receptor-interacting protein-like 1 [Columba livia]|nr:inositol 1; 4; 5-trisphosphate receptor-interacting protein-like 1 [Columba livia]